MSVAMRTIAWSSGSLPVTFIDIMQRPVRPQQFRGVEAQTSGCVMSLVSGIASLLGSFRNAEVGQRRLSAGVAAFALASVGSRGPDGKRMTRRQRPRCHVMMLFSLKQSIIYIDYIN